MVVDGFGGLDYSCEFGGGLHDGFYAVERVLVGEADGCSEGAEESGF